MTTAGSCATGTITEADLVACLPQLRAFARVLTGSRERADDLVQDTVVRALTAAHQFQVGTSLQAWMVTILRNLRYSELRRTMRVPLQSLDASVHQPAVPPSQEANLEFGDFRRAFGQLGDDQREALILVGADGLSYEEAAKVCDCAMGTIKSRVSRARGELRRILQEGSLTDKRRDTPAQAGYWGAPLGVDGPALRN
jgi:RNA polymerase sigma-70 factor (ECF subfamily)